MTFTAKDIRTGTDPRTGRCVGMLHMCSGMAGQWRHTRVIGSMFRVTPCAGNPPVAR